MIQAKTYGILYKTLLKNNEIQFYGMRENVNTVLKW